MPSNISGETIITIPGTISGDEENNSLTGTALNDSLFGYGGDDTLIGNDGDDYLNGGLGDDLMRGGNGNDRYVVDSHQDQVVETANGGTDDWAYVYVNNYVLPDFVENMKLFGNVYSAHGNSLDNVIQGNAGNNYLRGGGGEDTFYGLIGDDTYVVDSAGDKVIEYANTQYENHGIDTVLTYIDNYQLVDNVERLKLGGTADLKGFGNELDNTIMGNSGDNVIDGGLGDDNVFAGAGYDILKLNTDKTTNHSYVLTNNKISGEENAQISKVEEIQITGGDGYTFVNAVQFSEGRVELKGQGGNDFLVGTNNDDYLNGGQGNDTLLGKAGDDVFVANGSDFIDGGMGFDRVTYRTNLENIEVTNAFIKGSSNSGASSDAILSNIEDLSLRGGNNDNHIDARLFTHSLNLRGAGGDDSFLLGGDDSVRLDDDAVISVNGGSGYDTLTFEYRPATIESLTLSDEQLSGSGGTRTLVNLSLDQIEHVRLESNKITSYGLTLDASEFTGTVELIGTNISDTLLGGTNDDVLVGGNGSDNLIGGGGDDILIGGVGGNDEHSDRLTGGAGRDRFVLGDESGTFYTLGNPSNYTDNFGLVTDFNQTDDIIQLKGNVDAYRLGITSINGYNGVGIFLKDFNPATENIVGLIQGDTAGLDLNASYFEYV